MDSLTARIDALATDDNPNKLKPTTHAYQGLLSFLGNLEDISRGTVSTDANGAIYIYWRSGGKHLQLTYPANEKLKPYIYWRQGEDTDLLTDSTTDQLAERLAWLAK